MLKLYKDSSASIRSVERFVTEFKRDRTNIEDNPCEGRPKIVATSEMITKIKDIVLKNS